MQKCFIFILLALPLSVPAAAPLIDETKLQQNVPTLDSSFMLREASRRIEQADYLGAKLQLVLALKTITKTASDDVITEKWISGVLDDVHNYPTELHPQILEALYLYAAVLQEENDRTGAVRIFEALLTHMPNSLRNPDILFRCANAYSMSNDNERALALLKPLTRNSTLTGIDIDKLKLTHKFFKYRASPSMKRLKRLDIWMKRLPNSYFRQYRATLRLELLLKLTQANDALHFEGSQSQIVRHHRLRSKNHEMSVTQLAQIILLKRPTQVAQALLIISKGLLDTGDALYASPTPAGLSPEQQRVYRSQINLYVKSTWLNALRYTTEGVHLSTRLNLGEPLKTKTASLKEAISGRIEQLN